MRIGFAFRLSCPCTKYILRSREVTSFNGEKCWSNRKNVIYENTVGDILVKQGYGLYSYRNERSTIEMRFFVSDTDSLIPVEVKANNAFTPSLNNLTDTDCGHYPGNRFGIKLCAQNIGFNGRIYTYPYFLTFLLKRVLAR